MAKETYVAHCGGIVTNSLFRHYVSPQKSNVSNITAGNGADWTNITSKNETDADAYIFEKDTNTGKVSLHIFKSECSPKMICKYNGSGEVKIISNNEYIWQKVVDGTRVMVDYYDYSSGHNNNRIETAATSPSEVEFSFINAVNDDIPTSTNQGMFSGCTNLVSCEIPCQMRTISHATFSGCTSLTSYTKNYNFLMEIGDNAMSNCIKLGSLIIPHYATIGTGTFSGCTGATSIVWKGLYFNAHSTLDEIPDYAFSTCMRIGSTVFEDRTVNGISIPNGISSIGNYSFEKCTSIVSINLENVTSIGAHAFQYCENLTSVTSSYVNSIGTAAFINCWRLGNVNFSNYYLKVIDAYTFTNCSGLTSVTLSSSLTTIRAYSFENCSGLPNITIPSNVTTIEHAAFNNCSGLTSITIPNSVTEIGQSAFTNCQSSTEVNIGTGITEIKSSAFSGCTGLNKITIRATTPPTLGAYVFNDTNNCNIYVPSDKVSDYRTAYDKGWYDYRDRIQAITN